MASGCIGRSLGRAQRSRRALFFHLSRGPTPRPVPRGLLGRFGVTHSSHPFRVFGGPDLAVLFRAILIRDAFDSGEPLEQVATEAV